MRSTHSIGSAVEGLFSISEIVKKGLLIFLLFLPFQQFPNVFFGETEDIVFLKMLSYTDEAATIFLFIILISFIFVKPEIYKFRIREIPITVPLLLLILVAGVSIFWNGVTAFQGAFGVYDILKNIIVVYFFAALRWREEDLLFLISGIKVIVMILAVAGIAGELLALIGREPGYLTMMKEEGKRFGLYRVISLTGKGSTNYLGMYALLGTSLIYLTTEKGVKKISGVFLGVCLLFLTFSRQAWMGMFIMAALTNRRLILPGLFILMGVASMSIFTTMSYDPVYYYRSFTYKEAFHVFLDHPIIGAGPGMFGGVASVIFKSPYYDNWPAFYRGMIYKMGSLDAFWPSILAELGILGFLAYLFVWKLLYKRIFTISEWYKMNGDLSLHNVGTVLKNYIIALVIMCFFTGLNKPFVIYTFMALTGIYASLFLDKEDLSYEKKRI